MYVVWRGTRRGNFQCRLPKLGPAGPNPGFCPSVFRSFYHYLIHNSPASAFHIHCAMLDQYETDADVVGLINLNLKSIAWPCHKSFCTLA